MALLVKKDLENIVLKMEENIKKIEMITGTSIIEFYESIYGTKYKNEQIGIIPITSGNGRIDTFVESIQEVMKLFNFNSFITKNTDVLGVYEAINNNADIILMADDLAYIAYNLNNKKISNNQYATGNVYSEILIKSKENKDESIMNNKEVLVIGLGKVGKHAVNKFIINGYDIYIYDVDEKLMNTFKEKNNKIHIFDSSKNKKFKKIFEATPSLDTIPQSVLMSHGIVSTPGIPVSISKEIEEKYSLTLIAEPLGIGTVSMLYDVF